MNITINQVSETSDIEVEFYCEHMRGTHIEQVDNVMWSPEIDDTIEQQINVEVCDYCDEEVL